MADGPRLVRSALHALSLDGVPVCLHSSLRSFGPMNGGPDDIVDAFVEAGCTLLVPTFSWNAFGASPPPGREVARNGGVAPSRPATAAAAAFTPDSAVLDVADMGQIPAAVASRNGRRRGDHPLSSFCAIGPQAAEAVAAQTADDLWAPLRWLCRSGGVVVLAGVGLNRMTLLHLAEQDAGRRPFIRWATSPSGPVEVRAGGCSSGFERFAPILGHLERTADVGGSAWRIFDAAAALSAARKAIEQDASVTHCGRTCERCDDAVAGGPER